MQRIRGTRDILWNEMRYWRLIVEKAKIILEQAQYKEIYTPILETTDLFTKSIGQETDIVSKEMYNFTDQSNRRITLRPEGTVGVVRALVEDQFSVAGTVNRFWYFGPMFRYERPQNGRQRQFYQLGVEYFGATDPRADAEVIYLATQLLDNLTCKRYIVEINSIGDILSRTRYQVQLKNYLLPYINNLDDDSAKRLFTNPLRILDSKDSTTQNILSNAPKMYDFLDSISKQHFEKVCEYLNFLNIPYIINNNLVRGLDYYNKTAFEIKMINSRSRKTICGGGRYDSLVSQLGGNKIPAVGWAIGIERLCSLIEDKVQFMNSDIDIYIASQGKSANKYSLFVMKFLQTRHFTVIIDFSNKPFSKQLRKASKLSAVVCFIIGSNEMLNKTIIIKWLDKGRQEVFKQDLLQDYAQYLKYTINNIK